MIHDILLFLFITVGIPLIIIVLLSILIFVDQMINGEYTCDDPSVGIL